jgi:hypothetical protein
MVTKAVWCARFNEFITSDAQIDSSLKKDYQVYHLNYPATSNKKIACTIWVSPTFWIPCFIILDGNEARLHTKHSAYLEMGRS